MAVQGGLLALPAEIRNAIFEHTFYHAEAGLRTKLHNAVVLDEDYSAYQKLQCLLTCRQFSDDASLLAFHQTSFVVTNLFINIPQRLSLLQPARLQALRSIAYVADARHFIKLHVHHWKSYPFGIPQLRLDTLTIILHRSSAWHYLFDYTANIVQLLRGLQGVKRFVFVRNQAFVKGSFKTWYNRLVGLILKVDHHQRYNIFPPQPEQTWWSWSFDEPAQTFCLTVLPPKPIVDERIYIEGILPLVEELRISVENEEWNPDPRSWNGT
ncbi:hypothetical protein AMS68_000777 [Peltaster fructicola]|uniref:Uncharacterized protein n=1 Tax=Peltaster fructicola TaxID=286661 RepID=A0A6H0XL83_9PEZI|nr:hypothetical protein AMS68_000777 [Peltaster fructicola]